MTKTRKKKDKKEWPEVTCIACGETNKNPSYWCAFCGGDQHWACGCECTECGRPGIGLNKMCQTCKEAFTERDDRE